MAAGGTNSDSAQRAMDCIVRWLTIRELGGQPMPATYRQLIDDVRHSALLQRLLSGREPHRAPPPRSYGQPWYGLLEEGHATGCELTPLKDRMGASPRVAINECAWLVEGRLSNGGYLVRHGPRTPLFAATRRAEGARGWELRRVDPEPGAPG